MRLDRHSAPRVVAILEPGRRDHRHAPLAGALARNYALALVGVALVAGSIVYVLRVILPWPLSKLAHVRNKTIAHAAIFKTYLVLMLASLVVLAVLLARERGPGIG